MFQLREAISEIKVACQYKKNIVICAKLKNFVFYQDSNCGECLRLLHSTYFKKNMTYMESYRDDQTLGVIVYRLNFK